MTTSSEPSPLPWLVMIVSPLFFSANLVLGRFVVPDVAPFLLATMRWGAVALILAPLLFADGPHIARLTRGHWRRLTALGFLGMGICGGGIYLALKYTSATNAILIYTTSPVLVVLLERIFFGRRSSLREVLGMAIAFFGVAVIVLRGSLEVALSLSLNVGDLLVMAAAVAWAGYSIMQRGEPVSRLGNMQALGLIALFGALLNLPIALAELAAGDALPTMTSSWLAFAGIVIVPSLLAYSTYQYGVRRLGPAVTSVFMYLLPPYGVGLSIVFLGESFQPFHAAGIALVTAGVVLTTFPVALFRDRQWNRP